jgi:hypothetical protein
MREAMNAEDCTSCDGKELAARADGRVPPEDVRVSMAELEAIWTDFKGRGVLYNGMTGVALAERYGNRVYHVSGVGWFVRPMP